MTTTQTTFPFCEICEPGTYVCNWSGHLLQIPDNCFSGNDLNWNMCGTGDMFVTKISDDWTISSSDARELASGCDNISF